MFADAYKKALRQQGLEVVQMPYFNETDGAPERFGKVIGDILAALVVLGVFWIILVRFF